MKLTDEFDEYPAKSGIPLGGMLCGVAAFMIILVAVVLKVNHAGGGKGTQNIIPDPQPQQNGAVSVSDNGAFTYPLGESDLVSEDMDFWNMYKQDKPLDKTLDDTSERYAEKLKELEEENKEEDLSENGTKTEVILPDGTSQWVMINAYIEKNNYDYTGLVYEEPMMRYYSDAKKASTQGIRIDGTYGTVDFKKVADAGVDYCIVRMGRRGYATGEISLDENCLLYLNAAKEAKLGLGVSFYSQAASEAEAVEEAALVIQILRENEIALKYPVVFQMEQAANDKSRIDALTKNQLTAIAKAFCDTIRQNGYTPAVYGNKYWLLRKLDLTQLSAYDIWLAQESDVPDYPYAFDMWEYKQDAVIDGISGKVSMSISFIDYEMR